MRYRILAVTFAGLALVPVGCAGGFRLGGNRFGAGIGAYIGPVPDLVPHATSCYPLPPTGTAPPPETIAIVEPVPVRQSATRPGN